MEAAGFDARIVSIKKAGVVAPYIVQYACPILAPAVFSAACYMTFKRIVYYVTPDRYRGIRTLWVPARALTPIFVGFDVITFLIQLGGAAIVAGGVSHKPEPDNNKVKSGSNILKLGLVLQLICFGFFTFVGARFIFVSKNWRSEWPNTRWVRLNLMVNGACALILIRSIYRLIEFATVGGTKKSYFQTHEWLMWVFDAFLMLLVVVGFIFIHPGDYLPLHVPRVTNITPTKNPGDIEFQPIGNSMLQQPVQQAGPYQPYPNAPPAQQAHRPYGM